MTQSILEKMQDAGINVEPYKRGPFGSAVFAASVQSDETGEGRIRLWEGKTADIEIATDKRYRQAVLKISEGNRKITRNVNFPVHEWNIREPKNIRQIARANFPVWIPNVKYRVKILSMPEKNHDWLGRSFLVKTEVSAQAGSSTENLLMGFDEKYHFISALPTSVKTVEEAHKALRPTILDNGSMRQGEWFFFPVSKTIANKLDDIATKNPERIGQRLFERRSSHFAYQTIILDTKMYVTGYVSDSRRSHHDSLFLPEWNRVIRNKEIATPITTRGNRRRSWD